MKQFFITGTSSGIGKALAEKALEEGHSVLGISRRKNIEHKNYRHLNYDLGDYQNYKLVNFNINKEADELILVNNAGWLGQVKPLAEIRPSNIEKAFQINLIAPAILTKLFLEQTEKNQQKRTVLNISSGAASHTIPSWTTYCASKAGLEMLTKNAQIDHPEVRFLAVAPGIVDTEMQGEIRQVEKSDFPEKQRFVDYKEKGELSSPPEVAGKLFHILTQESPREKTILSLN